MSDQGEPAQRFSATGGDARDREPAENPTGPAPTANTAVGRPAWDATPPPVWESPAFDAAFDAAFGGTDSSASRSAAESGESEAAFDGMESGGGYSNYAGVDMSGPGTPAKAGVPSSGNWQMPDWMREEAPDGGFAVPDEPGSGGKGKIVLFAGVGVLVAALLAAGAVYALRSGGGKSPAQPTTRPKHAATSGATGGTKTEQKGSAAALPDAKLVKFPGTHSKAAGRINDTATGLSYPKLAAPWQVPTKKSGLVQPGWSAQQVLLTDRHAGQNGYGQLMTGALGTAEQGIYAGPGSEKAAAIAYAKSVEARFYSFNHKSRPLASQALDLPGSGGKGWLVSSQLTYHRAGVKATGEVVTVAVINTGKPVPAVLFMSIPDTHKKLYPDINFVIDSLKRA